MAAGTAVTHHKLNTRADRQRKFKRRGSCLSRSSATLAARPTRTRCPDPQYGLRWRAVQDAAPPMRDYVGPALVLLLVAGACAVMFGLALGLAHH